MCTWFSASWWCFRNDRKCLFLCIYNPQITISPTSLFSVNFNRNCVKNHPKSWTCPLSLLMTVLYLLSFWEHKVVTVQPSMTLQNGRTNRTLTWMCEQNWRNDSWFQETRAHSQGDPDKWGKNGDSPFVWIPQDNLWGHHEPVWPSGKALGW